MTEEYLEELHGEMLAAAANLEFERAAELRDRIAQLKGQPTGDAAAEAQAAAAEAMKNDFTAENAETQREDKATVQEPCDCFDVLLFLLCVLRVLRGETLQFTRFRLFYVTYIRTTPEKLWQALIDPEFTRRYWCETRQDNTSAGWPIFTGARPASFLVASRFVPVTMGERRDPAPDATGGEPSC